MKEVSKNSFKITERAEDYLRVIYRMINQQGNARVGDIASELKVKPASAFEMLGKLQKLGFVVHERYGEIELTKDGTYAAKAVSKRHDTFRKFLEIIFVPKEIAAKDASILEHRLDYRTTLQFTKFVDFMNLERPGVIKRWREIFKYYCDKEQDKQENVLNAV